jgi:hypothetical protein
LSETTKKEERKRKGALKRSVRLEWEIRGIERQKMCVRMKKEKKKRTERECL